MCLDDDVSQQISCILLCFEMTGFDKKNPIVTKEIMIAYFSGKIGIGLLSLGFANEVGTAASTESDGLDKTVWVSEGAEIGAKTIARECFSDDRNQL